MCIEEIKHFLLKNDCNNWITEDTNRVLDRNEIQIRF